MATIKFVAIPTLVMLLVAAEASIFRTTITTIEKTGESQQRQQCQKQMKGQQMDACRSFLRSAGDQRVRMLVLSSSSTQQDQCCQQLERVDEQCRCDIVEKMWSDMQQEQEPREGRQQEQEQEQEQGTRGGCQQEREQEQGTRGSCQQEQEQETYGGRRQEQESLRKKAQILPAMCGLKPQVCKLRQ